MNPAASKASFEGRPSPRPGDPQVGPVDVTPPQGTSPFMSLVRAVAHQQLTGKAATTILGRVLALYPARSSRARRTCWDAARPAARGRLLAGEGRRR
jgi:3-methyladenine DNA glycosylase/8-oxoguanine DNA glycosylase